MIRFVLPFPISVNAVYAVNKRNGHLYKTKEAKKYQRNAEKILSITGHADLMFSDDMSISIEMYCPSHRKHDIDNIDKLLFDSIVSARVIEDDDLIVEEYKRKFRFGCYEGEPKVIVELDKAELFD